MQDTYNNPLNTNDLSCQLDFTGNDKLRAQRVSWSCEPDVNGTALTAAVYTTVAGVYRVSLDIEPSDGGQRISMRLSLNVSATALDQRRSALLWPLRNASGLIAGEELPPFSVKAADEFGNPVIAECDSFTVCQ